MRFANAFTHVSSHPNPYTEHLHPPRNFLWVPPIATLPRGHFCSDCCHQSGLACLGPHIEGATPCGLSCLAHFTDVMFWRLTPVVVCISSLFLFIPVSFISLCFHSVSAHASHQSVSALRTEIVS